MVEIVTRELEDDEKAIDACYIHDTYSVIAKGKMDETTCFTVFFINYVLLPLRPQDNNPWRKICPEI